MKTLHLVCTSEQGHSIQPSVAGHGHFVCIRCWMRFICPSCAPGLEKHFAVYRCEKHRSRRA